MEVIPVAGALGAEIHDVDLRDPDLDVTALRDAILMHQVVFIPGASLTEEEHFALGRRLGEPSIFPVARLMGETSPTMTVLEDGPDSPNSADLWHTDVTWTATPPAFALLHMELSPEVGGDTLWCSATAAYDALSPLMQDFLCGLTVTHDNAGFVRRLIEKVGDPDHPLVEGLRRDYPAVVHPMIRTHPETGRRSILWAGNFISHINELTETEGRTVLDMIDAHVQDPRFHVRWRWTDGDLAIWDERSTLHRAAADHWPQRRVIRRCEIDGDRPYFDPDRQPVASQGVAR
ncbi:MAG: TauD/TfdA family dioxygenase [Actinomycetota bacterium]